MVDVRVAGAAVTRFGRRRESLAELAREAAAGALGEAGHPEVERVFVASQAPAEFTGDAHVSTLVTTALGLVPVGATRVESGPSSGASALEAAFFAVRSGCVRSALVVGAERMSHVPSAERTRVLAKMIEPGERALGLTMPALAALVARAYLERFGLSRDELAAVPVKAHAHGARNPDAHFQRSVTVEEVLAAPVIADPLRLYDCAPVSDGAAAVVLVADRGPVRVAGVGHATDQHALVDRWGRETLVGFRATRLAARQAFGAAGLAPGDVDVAEVHDAFSVLELLCMEDLGFFERGESLGAVLRGETSLGGRLPVNVGGGLKARGHPLGATGVAQVVELFRHLTGSAGGRQVDGARVGVAQNVGGFGNNNVVTVLEAVS